MTDVEPLVNRPSEMTYCIDENNLCDQLEILKAKLDVILSTMPGYEAELESNKAGAINSELCEVRPEPVTRQVSDSPPFITNQKVLIVLSAKTRI